MATPGKARGKVFWPVLVGTLTLVAGVIQLGHQEGSLPSFVVPPDLPADAAPLHLFVSAEHEKGEAWSAAMWHIYTFTCTEEGIRAQPSPAGQTRDARPRPLSLKLTYPPNVGNHSFEKASRLTESEAMTARLQLQDTSSGTRYRLLEGYLVLDGDRRSGRVEAILWDDGARMLFVNARWSCSAGFHEGD